MNEETQGALLENTIKEGAEYVAEYFEKARGKSLDKDEIESILEIYLDYLLLIDVTEVSK